jgi:hypothetical protein
MKCVIDLDNHGRMFRMNLLNLGISTMKGPFNEPSHLDFIYNEATSQVLLMYDANTHAFLIKLQNAPDVGFFSHIPQFINPHPQFVTAFTDYFKQYALGLLFQIHRRLGTRIDVDYLLEAIADDYIVLYQDVKRI